MPSNTEMRKLEKGAHDTEVQEARDGIFQTFVFGAVGAQKTKVGFVSSTEMALKY